MIISVQIIQNEISVNIINGKNEVPCGEGQELVDSGWPGKRPEGENFIPRPEGWEGTDDMKWELWVVGEEGEEISRQWEHQGQCS